VQRIACPEIDATIGAVRGYNLRDRDNRDARLGDNLASSPAYGAPLFELSGSAERPALETQAPPLMCAGLFSNHFVHIYIVSQR
jgi:hypothetical protein